MGSRSVYVVLAQVQHRVACPKGRVNKFGGYAYRSLEDINAALKPVCEELRCGYIFSDEAVCSSVDGGDNETDRIRWYIRAECTFWAEGCADTVTVSAYAREPVSKKGMDDAQVTGLASSYARKYAACAMFAIDSGEEVDAMDNRTQNKGRSKAQATKTTGNGETARKIDSTPATDEELAAVSSKVGEYAALCQRDEAEVMDALVKSKTMRRIGYDNPPTSAQAKMACQLLTGWIVKTKGGM